MDSSTIVIIANNQFTGSIPDAIFNASNLGIFQLDLNELSGKVHSLEKLIRISSFSISSNNFGNGGENDLSFLRSLTNSTFLTDLEISFNNFGGELPN